MNIKYIKNQIVALLRIMLGKKPKNFKEIPIFINNYNRLTTTKNLIECLQKRGYHNIHILDNQSTYPPLIDYYNSVTDINIHFLKKNIGSKAFWKSGIWLRFLRNYYVYTDSDLYIKDECPDNFLEYFYTILQKYPKAHKVGFSLQIDDLPDSYHNKNKVIEWESRYFERKIDDNLYIAPIDTTFALYRPFSKKGPRDYSSLVFRIGTPYQAKHMPWYINSDNPGEEEQYYANSLTTRTHWSRQNKK